MWRVGVGDRKGLPFEAPVPTVKELEEGVYIGTQEPRVIGLLWLRTLQIACVRLGPSVSKVLGIKVDS